MMQPNVWYSLSEDYNLLELDIPYAFAREDGTVFTDFIHRELGIIEWKKHADEPSASGYPIAPVTHFMDVRLPE